MKNTLFLLSKILIITISIGYIVFKIYTEKQDGYLFYELSEFSYSNWIYLLLVIFLMPINWVLESIKFKLLVYNLESITLKKAIQAVLTGVTVSIFTPKRIGDFGGRILFLEKQNRVSGVFATLLGSLSQLLVTLIIGGLLFPIYIYHKNILQSVEINIYFIYSIIAITILSAIFIYINIAQVGIISSRFSFLKKHNSLFLFLQKYSKNNLVIFFLISLARYSIFTFQFVLLLWVFNIDLPYSKAIIAISQVYFLMVIIPTFALGELGVRGSLSVWVFGAFTTVASGVIAVSVLLWFINLAIPSIIGTYFLSKTKY